MRLDKDLPSKSASNDPAQDRPGSAPPAGFIRKPVATRDAAVQSDPKPPTDDLEDGDNTSETASVASARSQPNEIKVVSYNDPIAHLPATSSTRSLDGNGPAERNYRSALTANAAYHRGGGHGPYGHNQSANVRVTQSQSSPAPPVAPEMPPSQTNSTYYGNNRGTFQCRSTFFLSFPLFHIICCFSHPSKPIKEYRVFFWKNEFFSKIFCFFGFFSRFRK